MPNWQENNQVKWFGVKPARQGTQVNLFAAATNAVVVIYTVPVGQVFYCCGVSLGAHATATGFIQIYHRTAVPVTVMEFITSKVQVNTSLPGVICSFWPPYEIPAGEQVVVESSALLLTARGSCWGWVE